MRKFFTILTLLSAFTLAATAQVCPFKVKFEVIPATCYNNGKVVYSIVDASGNVVTDATGLNLSEVRAYYSEVGDTVKHRTGLGLIDLDGHFIPANGRDTLLIDYGTYTIGVEGICGDGSGIHFTAVDTHTVLTIPTTYVKPSVSSLYVTANTEDGFGRRPTLACENTGRVQLKIEHGRYPYTVYVVGHGTTDTLRTVTFTEPMYAGTDENRYDYKDYYTFDSLPSGDWDFYLVDGCDYGLPRTGQRVEVVDYPMLDYVEVYASSGGLLDSNVVKINAVLDMDYSYYTKLMPTLAQYRFTYDGTPSSDWKPFPPVLHGYRAMLTDTVGERYCDIWGKEIKLEYRVRECDYGTVATERAFHLYKPNENYFVRDSSDIRDSVNEPPYTCDDLYWWHRWYHEIYYYYNDPSDITRDEDDLHYRHHYTHPLTWIYYDTERGDTIKKEVVGSISSHSRLYDTEVEALYGDFRSYTMAHPLMIPTQRTLVDAHGCVIYSRFDSLPYCYDHGPELRDWEIFHTDGDHCCTTKGSVGVREHLHTEVDPDGTTVILEKSPYENRYNFTAVYSSASKSWTVSRENLENFATIEGGTEGRSMVLRDYCLPSGPYWFKVMTPCDTYQLRQNIGFPDIYSTKMVEEPVFTMSQQCTDDYITYTHGKFAREARNTSVETGLPLEPVLSPLNTYFQIISGPPGGYDGSLHQVNDPIRISMPGDFVVKIAPSSSLYLCDLPTHYDTIHYEGATVEFVYAYAYLCDSNSTQGTAYVKGTNGTPPYTYTFFSDIDLQGDTLGVITMSDTTQPAVFVDKPMNSRREMSCLIKDACEAYFHVNFYPHTMAELQKIWFDNGLKVMETCEGSTISAHALDIASILKYEWYNPNKELIDSVSSPHIFIPRHAADGWYKVVIRNTDCEEVIVDSVELTVDEAPSITLSHDLELCPGEEASISFTPTSPLGPVAHMDFTIAFENGNGIETRTYSSSSGVTVNDSYMTFTDAKIYPISNSDGHCDYTLADQYDTMRIKVKKDIADACTLMGSYDTVCYGSDARFLARSTMEPPYTIRWYSDYEMTHPLKSETITDAATWSYYDTLALTHHAEVFVSIDKEDVCPTVYGLPTNTVDFGAGSTEIECGQVIRLYDDGGADGDYGTGANTRHTYTTTDGKSVTIHFDDLDLSETSHLLIITGTVLSIDSVLYDLTAGSANPGVVTSHGNALTLYFIPGMKPAPGWSAIVEHQPGMSVADVWKKNEVVLRDEVCQSQTNTYDDPYGVVPNVVPDLSILNKNLRKAGTYTYTQTIEGADRHGCDSTVTFILTVNPPVHHDTTVVTTNFILNDQGGYVWPVNGRTYTTTGRYSKRTGLPDGCDSLDILDFIVLQIDTTDNEICRDDTTRLGVTVTTPELTFRDDVIPPTIAVGDVLCDDGSIMKVDSFLISGKEAKGVVFHVDRNGKGLAVALTDAYPNTCNWVNASVEPQIKSKHYSFNTNEVFSDTNGYGNTIYLKEQAESVNENGFQVNAPALYYCYYYNHHTSTTGSSHVGWYMPSAGEMNLLFANAMEVNATLGELNSVFPHIQRITRPYYWVSTGFNWVGKAYIFTSSGKLENNSNISGGRNYNLNYCRAIVKF